MNEKGGISVQTEHIFPVIKRWLYSDKDIFLREIVSNACDAITKLKHLSAIGQADNISNDFHVNVIVNEKEKTITVKDNGIGMSADEVKKYINQIALSGALDFIEKYEGNGEATNDGIIGHFGLGFYSSFMVSDTVEIYTKSYTDVPGVKWVGTDDGDFEMSDMDKTDRGTEIIMHITDDAEEYLHKNKITDVLNKYCSFMPVPIFLEFIEDVKKDKDGKDIPPEEPKQINDTEPLWYKQASQCTDKEYEDFYHKVFNDYKEPLFHIHINADYPLNFKGILYFPRLGHEYESLEGQIKLYYNRVFVADNIKEVIPEYLLMLKGVLDCPELPLNVSRSYLQNSGYVSKISQHIIKKVCDKLISLHDTQPEKYQEFWDDIKTFVEYACIRDNKFFDRVKGVVLFKTVDNEYVTLKEYLDKSNQNDDTKERRVYYTSDATQQAVYINMYKKQNVNILVLDNFVDNNFITLLEHNEKNIKFFRIDSDTDALKNDSSHNDDKNDELKKIFIDVSGNSKLKVETTNFKDENMPALLNISEESRRIFDMMRMYNMSKNKDIPQLDEDATLVLNLSNSLINKINDQCKTEVTDVTKAIAKQVYTLALIGQRKLSANELNEFLTDSYNLLSKI